MLIIIVGHRWSLQYVHFEQDYRRGWLKSEPSPPSVCYLKMKPTNSSRWVTKLMYSQVIERCDGSVGGEVEATVINSPSFF
jgi:hypothetical protein